MGHLISTQGIAVDPAKIETVVKRERPQTVTEVRGFLGWSAITDDLWMGSLKGCNH